MLRSGRLSRAHSGALRRLRGLRSAVAYDTSFVAVPVAVRVVVGLATLSPTRWHACMHRCTICDRESVSASRRQAARDATLGRTLSPIAISIEASIVATFQDFDFRRFAHNRQQA